VNWRRRLAHELRNPLFPMQITVENLQKARQLDAKQFLEVFHESTATLKAELANLNTIRLGGSAIFQKMPAPQFVRMNVNEALRNAVRLFEPQFNEVGKPTITPELFLEPNLCPISTRIPTCSTARFQNLGLECAGRHACRRDADPANLGTEWPCAHRSGRHGQRPDTGRVLAAVHPVLHDESCKERGSGSPSCNRLVSDHHGAIFGDQRRGPRYCFSNRTAATPSRPCCDTARAASESKSTAVDSGRGFRLTLHKGPKLAPQSSSAHRR